MNERCFFCEFERGPLTDPLEICKECCDFNNFKPKIRMTQSMAHEYERFKKEEEWINDKTVEFDRDTALAVLKELSKRMYPSHDLFGEKTLVIKRNKFEAVRKKFLG